MHKWTISPYNGVWVCINGCGAYCSAGKPNDHVLVWEAFDGSLIVCHGGSKEIYPIPTFTCDEIQLHRVLNA